MDMTITRQCANCGRTEVLVRIVHGYTHTFTTVIDQEDPIECDGCKSRRFLMETKVYSPLEHFQHDENEKKEEEKLSHFDGL